MYPLNRLAAAALIALSVTSCATSPPQPSSPPQIQRDVHGRIVRSAAAIAAFKRLHPCPSTMKPTGPCPGYIIDHVIALKRGGADSPANMQWQTVEDAKAKDRVE